MEKSLRDVMFAAPKAATVDSTHEVVISHDMILNSRLNVSVRVV